MVVGVGLVGGMILLGGGFPSWLWVWVIWVCWVVGFLGGSGCGCAWYGFVPSRLRACLGSVYFAEIENFFTEIENFFAESTINKGKS